MLAARNGRDLGDRSDHDGDHKARSIAAVAKRSGFGRLAVGVAALLLLWLGLLELGLRAFWHNPYREEGPERVLKLRIHHPNADYRFDRAPIDPERPTVRYRTDARSYVVPSRRFENPDATVVFLGGSTTESLLVQEEQRFPARVSVLLEEKGLRVDTLNAGRSGNVLHDGLNQIVNHVIEDRPDVAVFWFLGNDIYLLLTRHSYASRMGVPSTFGSVFRMPLQDASTHSSVAALLRSWAYGARPPVPRPTRRSAELQDWPEAPLEPYERRLRAALQLARALGMKPVFMTEVMPSHPTPNHARFQEAARRVVAEEGAFLFDLDAYVHANVPNWDEPMVLTYDGTHLSDHGSEIVARFVAGELLAQGLLPLDRSGVAATSPPARTP
jgi:lysophospholipase L1-like esterase